jgi:hypothetical protein
MATRSWKNTKRKRAMMLIGKRSNRNLVGVLISSSVLEEASRY